MQCPNCQVQINSVFSNCPSCGVLLNQKVGVQVGGYIPGLPIPPQTKQCSNYVGTIIRRRCTGKINDVQRFCGKCGNAV